MADFNLDLVVQEFGARYTPEGQTAKDIKTQLFTPSATENFFALRPNDGDYFKSAFSSVDEVTQAFSIPFVKKGTVTFKPWESKLGVFKVDQLFTPDKFRNSWLGFLASIKEVDRSKWPVLIWYIRQMLLPKIGEEMEDELAFYGWQLTGYDPDPLTRTVDGATLTREFESENSVTPANAAMDGIKLQIIRMVNAARANVINSGAWATDPVTFCTQVEDFVEQIDPKLRRNLDFLFASETLVNRYIDGRREKYNKYYAQESDLLSIDKSPLKMQKLDSMFGAEKVWATPAANRVRALAKDSDGRFDMQKADRSVKIMNDWKKVLTFDVPEFVVTNDLENSITAADITERY
jgi:hypothetical protein